MVCSLLRGATEIIILLHYMYCAHEVTDRVNNHKKTNNVLQIKSFTIDTIWNGENSLK